MIFRGTPLTQETSIMVLFHDSRMFSFICFFGIYDGFHVLYFFFYQENIMLFVSVMIFTRFLPVNIGCFLGEKGCFCLPINAGIVGFDLLESENGNEYKPRKTYKS